jgi:hypothetical protein
VFLKNTAVGDVMFWELDNCMKSYDYGDILLVYTTDIMRTKALASILSKSSLQNSYHELTLNVSKVAKVSWCNKRTFTAHHHSIYKFIQYAPRVLTFLLNIKKNTFATSSDCTFLKLFAVKLFPILQKVINILTHHKNANNQSISATNLT